MLSAARLLQRVPRVALARSFAQLSTPEDINIAEDLGSVLAREIAYEKSNSDFPRPDAVLAELRAAFPDFKVDVQAGYSTFTLHKSFQDETLKVEVNACAPQTVERGMAEHVDLEGSMEEEMEPETMDVIGLTITVTKPGKEHKLQLTCGVTLDENPELEIINVQIVPATTSQEAMQSQLFYEGPEFAELDVSLQKSWMDYLYDRGFDERFTEAIRDLTDLKEQSEYISWLEAAHAFVDGPEPPVLEADR
jgi:complement component 1 Q subcomponent-binding protein